MIPLTDEATNFKKKDNKIHLHSFSSLTRFLRSRYASHLLIDKRPPPLAISFPLFVLVEVLHYGVPESMSPRAKSRLRMERDR